MLLINHSLKKAESLIAPRFFNWLNIDSLSNNYFLLMRNFGAEYI